MDEPLSNGILMKQREYRAGIETMEEKFGSTMIVILPPLTEFLFDRLEKREIE